MNTTLISGIVNTSKTYLDDQVTVTVRDIMDATKRMVQLFNWVVTPIELMAARGELIRHYSTFIPA